MLVVDAQLVMLPFDPQDHVATTTAVAFQIGGVAYFLGFVMLMLLVVASHEWLAVEAGRLGVTATIGAAVGTWPWVATCGSRRRGPLAGRRGADAFDADPTVMLGRERCRATCSSRGRMGPAVRHRRAP